MYIDLKKYLYINYIMPPKNKEITESDDQKINSQNDDLETYNNFYPLCFELPQLTTNIFKTTMNCDFSNNIDYPGFEHGFHHFIHQSKNNMGEVTKDFEGKKKVWRVLNKFESSIDNYNKSISDMTREFFNLDKKPNILSRAFYKLWEIFMYYDIIDLDKDKFTSAHLAEGPGSFIQATIMYRDMFGKKGISKNDKYYSITIHPEGRSYVPEMDKSFIDFYEKENPKRVFMQKTYSKQKAGKYDDRCTGDLTDPKTFKIFGGEIKGKCDLVTADGGFENLNENLQEQEGYRLILSEIINAIQVQAQGGSFICKLFETFTTTSMKIISILRDLYENIYFVKPLTSRPSNSEKYVVCTKFKYNENNKEYKSILETLENLLELMHKNKSLNVVGIFNKFSVPKDIKNTITNMNIIISNYQIKNVNEIITFVKGNVYSGEEYYNKRDNQIDGAKYWTDLFYIDPNNFDKNKKKLINMKEKSTKVFKKIEEKLNQNIAQ